MKLVCIEYLCDYVLKYFHVFFLDLTISKQTFIMYVVVQFYPWFKFYFLCFVCGNLMIMSLKQRK